jgi:hypothetical protein
METHLDHIRAAVADGATHEARATGIAACRAILVALEAASAASSTPEPPPTAAPPPPKSAPTPTLGAMPALVALRAAPRDQVLDYVIAKLKLLQPAAAATTGPAAAVQAITALRTLSLDQLVDLAVAKLRTSLAPQSTPAPHPPLAMPDSAGFAPAHGQLLPHGTRVIHLAPPQRKR